MARIILLAIIGFVVWLLFKGFFKSQVKDDTPAGPAAKSEGGEDMVACSRCGVNLPRSETKEEGGRITCREPDRCKHAG